jgi:hypothetical protein
LRMELSAIGNSSRQWSIQPFRKKSMARDDQPALHLVDELPLPASAERARRAAHDSIRKLGQGTSEGQEVNMECPLCGLRWLLKEGKGEVL